MKHLAAAALVATLSVPLTAEARTITFSGYTWTVKNSSGEPEGPGPNVFSAGTNSVWVDSAGRLHLKIQKQGGVWTCAEVTCTKSLGYGSYRATFDTPVDALDPNVVLALFTWSDNAAYYNREIDIELSRWSIANNQNAQYVVQPTPPSSHIHRFNMTSAAPSNHGFRWQPGSVVFTSFSGTGQGASALLQKWQYLGSAVPPPGTEHAHFNLWLNQGHAPKNGQPVEVIISKFQFTP